MADSRMLRLFQACRQLQEQLTETLVARLRARAYQGVTAGHLTFLAELECGENHAAELARRTGISRQAVHKQVKELAALGLLDERPDPRRRNQRTIVFTDRGIQLIADARAILAEMDAELPASADGATPDDVLAFLGAAHERLDRSDG
jgi:DNA-binding MarR family transcriptional regulator